MSKDREVQTRWNGKALVNPEPTPPLVGRDKLMDKIMGLRPGQRMQLSLDEVKMVERGLDHLVCKGRIGCFAARHWPCLYEVIALS
jgi:hypothetical protein